MIRIPLTFALATSSALLLLPPAAGEAPAADRVSLALLPAPEAERAAATVLAPAAEGAWTTVREGTGTLVCLADDPADERVHVACYHRDLEPFMARGRELKAAGADRATIEATRRREIEAGTLAFPREPRALYTVTAPGDGQDPATGVLKGARRVYVLYLPFATAAETGLPPRQMTPSGPWIMAEGEPWAHVMIVQEPADVEIAP